MDQVDTFVLLDTVAFDYRSWQHRNRIPGPDGEPTWLSVPVSKATRRSAITDVEIATRAEFPDRHVNVLAERYRDGPAPGLLDEVTARIAGVADGRLVDLTVPRLAWLADRFAITTPLVLASELPGEGRRSELLATLTEAVGADRYVSPPAPSTTWPTTTRPSTSGASRCSCTGTTTPATTRARTPFSPTALRRPGAPAPRGRARCLAGRASSHPVAGRRTGGGRVKATVDGAVRLDQAWDYLHALPRYRPAYPSESVVRFVARRLGRPAEDPSVPPKRVLDMGVAPGVICPPGRRRPRRRRLGLLVGRPRPHPPASGRPDWLAGQAPMQALPFRDGTFDAVVAWAVVN